MTVYVDDALIPYRGSRYSHLMADDLDELHEFAARIGLKRAWFQPYPEHSIPHYDVSEGKRHQAIRAGAVAESAWSDSMRAFRREWRRRAKAGEGVSRSAVLTWKGRKLTRRVPGASERGRERV